MHWNTGSEHLYFINFYCILERLTDLFQILIKELDALQTYPVEIISGLLYLGNWNHGNIPYIQKDLKIKAHINCSVETDTLYVLLIF